MDQVEIAFLFLLILAAAVALYFPIYLLRRSRHKRTAINHDPKLAPSKVSIVSYSLFLAFALISFLTLPFFIGITYVSVASEARANLWGIAAAENAYFAEHGNYPGGKDVFKVIGWKSDGGIHYSYYLGQGIYKNEVGDIVHFSPASYWPFKNAPDVSRTGFTAFAIRNIDTDDCPDVWTINDSKLLIHYVADRDDKAVPGACSDCPWATERSAFGQWLVDSGLDQSTKTALFIVSFPLEFLFMIIFIIFAIKDWVKYKELLKLQ